MKIEKHITPITIVLETDKEVDLFFHIVNYAPRSEAGYYPFGGYKATFEEMNKFRKTLYDALRELDIEIRLVMDC